MACAVRVLLVLACVWTAAPASLADHTVSLRTGTAHGLVSQTEAPVAEAASPTKQGQPAESPRGMGASKAAWVAQPVDLPSGGDKPPLQAYLSRVLPEWALAATEEPPGEGSVGALDLVGGNFPIADYPDAVSDTEELNRPSIAYNSRNGEHLVVWHGYVRATSTNIYARRLSSSGAPAGGIVTVCAAAGAQFGADVAYDALANQYWVVWCDNRSGTQLQVYARRISSAGSPVGNEIMVNEGSPTAFAPRVACVGGSCAIVWASDPGGGSTHVLIRGYDASGNAFTPVFLLSAASGVATEPDICASDEILNFVIVWYESHAGTGWDIMGYGMDYLLRAWGPFNVSSASGHQKMPMVAYNPAVDRYCVVWQDGRSQTSWDVYGQLLLVNGAPVGGALPILATNLYDGAPAIASHGSSSQFLVALEHDISGAGQNYIYGCLVAGAGGVGSPFVVRGWYNSRTWPAVACGAGTYTVAWVDSGAGTQPDIQAQRVATNGALSGSLAVVAAGRKGQESPAIAYNSVDNEYLAVWHDYRSGLDYDIYARRVAGVGQSLGTEVVIRSTGALNGNPSLAYNWRAGQYLIAWQEVTSPSSGYEIYAQRVNGSGQAVGAAFLVSSGTQADNEGSCHVAYNDVSNEYLVVWHAFTNSSWNIWGQRLSATGQLLGTSFLISASSATEHNPRATHNRQQNEYVVVWQDARSSEGRVDVYGQRLNSAGGAIGGNLAVSTASGDKGLCDLAYNPQANEYLVVWGDGRSGSDIYGQRLSGGCALLGSDFPVSAASNSEIAPAVSFDSLTGEYLVVWWEFYDASDWDIYASRVSATGGALTGKFPLSAVNEVQTQPELAQNLATGEFLIVWQDFRAGSYDLYGQRWVSGAVVVPTSTPTQTPTRTPSPTATRTPTLTVTPTPTRTRPPVTGPYHVRLPVVLKGWFRP